MGKKKLQMITRKAWGGNPPPDDIEKLTMPIRSIYLTHTSTPKCETYEECSNTLKVLQKHYCEEMNYKDLPFNSRQFFEGRGWFINGIPAKAYEEEKVEKINLIRTIDNFMEDLNIYKGRNEEKQSTVITGEVDPSVIIKALKKKQFLEAKPPSQVGISIAFIDDLIRYPKIGTKRGIMLLDFIIYGIKKKMIHQDFIILMDDLPKQLETEGSEHLWKGREHTPQYKMAMEIRKLNEQIPKTRLELDMLSLKKRKVK